MESNLTFIIKRDKTKVSFNRYKIQDAIRKAFLSQSLQDDKTIQKLTDDVVSVINLQYSNEKLPAVEDIQDIVERIIIKHNYIDIAKAYIIYRENHKEQREKQILNQIKEQSLQISHDDGSEDIFQTNVIRSQLKNLCFGLSNIKLEVLVKDVCKNVFTGISTSEINQLIISTVKSYIEMHYDYSYLASRLVLNDLYEDILETNLSNTDFQQKYRLKFSDYIKKGVENRLINEQLKKKFDLKKISSALVPERDLKFMYLGIQTIFDRYLLRERESRKVFELPAYMWMRVAMGLALNEKDKTEKAIEFYNVLSSFYLISSTPTLFNSGTNHSQMSSCYLNTIEDSLEGIFKNYADNAQLSKWAGGIGTDWTQVRATGSHISGTNGESSGIIPFIKIFNDVAIAVNQGGKRKGAMAAYLENWHIDIDEFLELKKNTGDERRRAHDIHPAVFISDLFMKRVKNNDKWTLFSPNVAPELYNTYGKDFEKKYIEYENANLPGAKTINAVDQWRKLLTMLYETGHPWITYKDACNVRSPQDHVGVIRSSNLCTEITLNTSSDETAVCNLASINLSEMIHEKRLDEELIKATVTTGIRMLDNVIDINYYPTPESKNSNFKHRPIGLGMMGYQDALYKLGISFDSEENINFADRSMEMVSYYAILASSKLAAERGTYQTYRGSKWDRGIFPIDTLDLLEKERSLEIKVDRNKTMNWELVQDHVKQHGMRNSNTLAIAPTATIANITGVTPCVEPIFKNIYMKENLSGNFLIINKYLVDHLQRENLWNKNILNKIKYCDGSIASIDEIPQEIKDLFKEVFEIPAIWIIKAVAKRSKWIDQSASTNLFLITKSGKEISDVYTAVWEMGIKTTYYLRTLAASQISKTTTVETEEKQPVAIVKDKINESFATCLISDDPNCEVCQ